MDSVDLQVLKTAEEWVRAGRRVVLATVVKTWGSSPRPIGALSAIRDDGMVVGSVSGGCVEDDMIDGVRRSTGPRATRPPRACGPGPPSPPSIMPSASASNRPRARASRSNCSKSWRLRGSARGVAGGHGPL